MISKLISACLVAFTIIKAESVQQDDLQDDLCNGQDCKIGVFSDIHLFLKYGANSPASKYCIEQKKTKDDHEEYVQSILTYGQTLAPLVMLKNKISNTFRAANGGSEVAKFGRVGCDTPKELANAMMQLFVEENKDDQPNFILVAGDYIAHKISLGSDDKPNSEKSLKKYAFLKKTHEEVQKLFTLNFPDTPVFFAFGNNDCKYHYSPPLEEKEEFYDFMFDLWFKKHPSNQRFADSVKETFLNGGYYKIDINKDLSVVPMNTLYFNNRQVQETAATTAVADEQMAWLQSLISDKESTRKYILLCHIYAGARVKHNQQKLTQNLWMESYNQQYFKLISENRDKLVLEVTGHDHWEDLRVDLDSDGNPYRNLLVSTGMALNNFQLPGFNTFKVDATTLKPKQLIATNLVVTAGYGQEDADWRSFPVATVDFEKDYGMIDITAKSIKERMNKFQNADDASREVQYISDKLGFEPDADQEFTWGKKTGERWSLINDDLSKSAYFFCQNTQNENKEDLDACIQKILDKNKQAAGLFYATLNN